MTTPNYNRTLLTVLGDRRGTTEVARKGDVLLVCDQTTILVSSEVLTRNSSYFGALLGPNFFEGQAPRSAENPQRIELPDDDSVGTILLCYYLHSGLGKVHPRVFASEQYGMPTSERLAQLAISADKYHVVEYLNENEVVRLLEPFRKVGYRKGMPFEQMADLAVTAYLLEHEELFSLFTRCLVLDYCEPLSNLLPSHFYDHVGAVHMLFMEDQRRTLRHRINQALVQDCSRIYCPYCGNFKHDPGFSIAVAAKLTAEGEAPFTYWLPDHPGCSLRDQLRALYTVGPYTAFGGRQDAACPTHLFEASHDKKYYEEAADVISKNAPGLCLACTREGMHTLDCEHEMELKQRFSKLDTLSSHVFQASK